VLGSSDEPRSSSSMSFARKLDGESELSATSYIALVVVASTMIRGAENRMRGRRRCRACCS
jgi:hypothetical protein